ncbi:MAG: hypothetical protein RLW61_10870 [Gammaproteobacteria bacterium]
MSTVATPVVGSRYFVNEVMYGMSREQALALFRTLPALGPQELRREYTGHVHDGGDLALRAKRRAFFLDESSELGSRLGKSYLSDADGHGQGHNIWRRAKAVTCRNLRFRTEIAASAIDGRPSLMMYYGAYNSFCGDMDLIDEIRRIDDGVYLGVYTCTQTLEGFSVVQPGNARSAMELFALTGPTGLWVGVDDSELEVI